MSKKTLLSEAAGMAAETADAVSQVLKVRPMHVRASGDEALIEWKAKLKLYHHDDDFWFSMFAAPHLGKSDRNSHS